MTDDDLTQLLALDGAPGPALPLSPGDANVIVAGALAGAGFGPPGGPGDGGGTSSAAHGGASSAVRGGLAGGTKLAIMAVVIATAVVIAILVLRRPHAAHMVAPPVDAAIDAPPDAAAAGSGSAAIPATLPDDDTDIELDPEPAHSARPRPAETRDPADLLGEANTKRAAKQWRESDALYIRVVKRAPKSLAAQTALVASASLHLEHLGDPRGAAKRFRRALAIAPGGALAEEARWGLAEAARALHDDAGEARALDDFLAHHAASPLAARARARRSELP